MQDPHTLSESTHSGSQPDKTRKSRSTGWLFAILGPLAFCSLTVASANYIPSESMVPTLEVGEQVMVNKLDRKAERGDIVVFRDDIDWMEAGSKNLMIKRVIGIAGDTVECCSSEGNTVLNGRVQEEPYAVRTPQVDWKTYSTVVPAGKLFMVGDNRPDSLDSRHHLTYGNGFVSVDSVVGTAYAVRWPLTKMRLLHQHDD